MPDRNQHLSDKPDTKGITLNVVQCKGCGLVQLDNEPVWYWKEIINSSHLSKEFQEIQFKYNMNHDWVSFNILEHQPNPNEYLQHISEYVMDNGAVIQVPNCENMNKYDFCIDHLMYFDSYTLSSTLMQNGFILQDLNRDFHNSTLSAVVRKPNPINIDDNFDYIKLHHFLTKHNPIGIYGAGHQAFALLSHDEMLSKQTKCVIDDNVEKRGRYTPATNIPIRTPDALKEVDAIIIMAGGYSDEVLKKLDDFKGSVAVLRGNKLEVIR